MSNTPSSDLNGVPLISKTDLQGVKYADVNGDGTVDWTIFADLLVGGNGRYGENAWAYDFGKYTMPTISSSKEYYSLQKKHIQTVWEVHRKC